MPDDVQTRRPGEVGFNTALLVFSLFMFWQAYSIDGLSSLSSAGAFPMAMTAIMSATAAITLFRSARRRSPQGGMTLFRKEVLPPVVVVFAAFIFAYSLLLQPLGFVLASYLFLVVSIWFLEGGRFRRAVLLSTVSIIAVYIVFRLIFQVVLPEGFLAVWSLGSAIGSLLSGAS